MSISTLLDLILLLRYLTLSQKISVVGKEYAVTFHQVYRSTQRSRPQQFHFIFLWYFFILYINLAWSPTGHKINIHVFGYFPFFTFISSSRSLQYWVWQCPSIGHYRHWSNNGQKDSSLKARILEYILHISYHAT